MSHNSEYSALAFKLAQLRIEAICNGYKLRVIEIEERIAVLANAIIHNASVNA